MLLWKPFKVNRSLFQIGRSMLFNKSPDLSLKLTEVLCGRAKSSYLEWTVFFFRFTLQLKFSSPSLSLAKIQTRRFSLQLSHSPSTAQIQTLAPSLSTATRTPILSLSSTAQRSLSLGEPHSLSRCLCSRTGGPAESEVGGLGYRPTLTLVAIGNEFSVNWRISSFLWIISVLPCDGARASTLFDLTAKCSLICGLILFY